MLIVEDTTLLYSIDHPDSENNFTVTVVPINEVGAGQLASSEPFLFSVGKKTKLQVILFVHNNHRCHINYCL